MISLNATYYYNLMGIFLHANLRIVGDRVFCKIITIIRFLFLEGSKIR